MWWKTKKKKKEIYSFKANIYPYTFWVVFSFDTVTKYFQGRNEDTLDKPDSTASACVYRVKEKETGEVGSLLYIVDEKVTIDTLGHEAVHLADGLYSFIGKDVDIDNDEDYAYLVGFIIKKIYELCLSSI